MQANGPELNGNDDGPEINGDDGPEINGDDGPEINGDDCPEINTRCQTMRRFHV